MTSHGHNYGDDIDIVDDGWNALWRIRNEKRHTSVPYDPHDSADDDTKVAPAYDGRTSLFAFEDAIDDWCDITELEAERRGPALRNQTRRWCRSIQNVTRIENYWRDPGRRCELFQTISATSHFIKGAQAVFLYKFIAIHATTTEVQWTYRRWMTRFQLTANRLIESWMGLISDLDLNSPEVIATIAQRRASSWRTTTESCRYCSSYSRCTSTCQRALEWWDVQTSPCTAEQRKTFTAETGFPIEWQFVSIDFCMSGRLDAGSTKRTD